MTSCSCVGVFIMLLFICLVNASLSDSITARVNYSVIFRRMHAVEVVTDYWFHTFTLQLPDVNDPSSCCV